jgi:N-acetylmuramoyl-L-alanine amidase
MPWSRCGLAALLFFARMLATPAAAATAATVAEQAAAQRSPAPAPAPAPPAALPQVPSAPAPPPAAPGPPSRFLVVLDAAHGGDDLGGHLSSGQFEKNVNLALSVRLRSLLGARGIQVITTRESDQSVPLDRRAAIANHAGAGACISLHSAETGTGVHLFVSSLAPVAPTRFVAWNTAQAGWVTRSLVLAGVLNSALLQAGMSVTLGRAPLPAVENMTCPAVTIEIAPERDSEHKITAESDDPDYQARVAATLAAAILEWRGEGHQP